MKTVNYDMDYVYEIHYVFSELCKFNSPISALTPAVKMVFIHDRFLANQKCL